MALPFLAIGIGVATIVERYFTESIFVKIIQKGKRSIFTAACLGALLPGCACATIPMAHTLKKKGLNLSAITTFIMISPLLGPHTIIFTYGLLGLKFTVARIVTAFIGAIFTGFFFYLFIKNDPKLTSSATPEACCHTNNPPPFLNLLSDITKQLAPYFFIGILIAAIIQTFVPITFLQNYASSDSIWTYVWVALLGIPIYVCEGEEIPITLGLMTAGLGHGPALAFMLGAVGTCIPTILMAQTIIGKRNTLIYVAIWFGFVFLAGLLFQQL